jgi:hypothetical protein
MNEHSVELIYTYVSLEGTTLQTDHLSDDKVLFFIQLAGLGVLFINSTVKHMEVVVLSGRSHAEETACGRKKEEEEENAE